MSHSFHDYILKIKPHLYFPMVCSHKASHLGFAGTLSKKIIGKEDSLVTIVDNYTYSDSEWKNLNNCGHEFGKNFELFENLGENWAMLF